ncbi:MAG TPA: DUF5979 domain-containing protein, partial [Acidimicrobiia bacterium]
AGLSAATLTVTKVVDGTAPPGAEWVVDIDCPDATMVTPAQMTFTGSGSQTATITNINATPVTCTVVESATAGASVTYACEVTDDKGNEDNACVTENSVHYVSSAAAATITVTNTYVPAPGPPPAPGAAAAEPPAAEPIAAAARFTG